MTLSATLAWRYLVGRGARSLLTTLAVALGVMLTFGLNGITPALEAAFAAELDAQPTSVDRAGAVVLVEASDVPDLYTLRALRALNEADAYDGPSLVIAYSHCINHGIDMKKGLVQQKMAGNSGSWVLYRYDPRLAAEGKNPLQLDSREPSINVADYAYNETRYRMLLQQDEERAEELMKGAQADAKRRWSLYSQMAAMDYSQMAENAGGDAEADGKPDEQK